MTFPTITTSALCPACRGEGSTETDNGHQFDARMDQFYPSPSILTPCEPCDGTGEIVSTTCLMCGSAEDDCQCDEDDLEAYQVLGEVA